MISLSTLTWRRGESQVQVIANRDKPQELFPDGARVAALVEQPQRGNQNLC